MQVPLIELESVVKQGLARQLSGRMQQLLQSTWGEYKDAAGNPGHASAVCHTCRRTVQASLLPRMAAQWRGVQPSRSPAVICASSTMSSRMLCAKPLYAAQCSGVLPSMSGLHSKIQETALCPCGKPIAASDQMMSAQCSHTRRSWAVEKEQDARCASGHW